MHPYIRMIMWIKNPGKNRRTRIYSFAEVTVTRLPMGTRNFTCNIEEPVAGKGECFDKVAANFCHALEAFCQIKGRGKENTSGISFWIFFKKNRTIQKNLRKRLQ